jgi:hypothetical protein
MQRFVDSRASISFIIKSTSKRPPSDKGGLFVYLAGGEDLSVALTIFCNFDGRKAAAPASNGLRSE